MSRVEILMAVRDGAAFLPAQLASIEAQRGVDWTIAAGDDGSRDGSAALLAEFAARTGRLEQCAGPQRGAAANFMSLLSRPPVRGFTAFADQDDVWLPDRLARAVRMLGPWDADEPRLYASRTILTDVESRRTALSPRRRAPAFRNALLQNVLPGNTMVMNAAARRLLAQAALAAGAVPFHDWWAYALMTGAGGRIVFDDRPGLLYRQHGRNLVGAHRGLAASAARLRMVVRGAYGGWLRANAEALSASGPLLSASARADLDRFRRVFDASWRARLAALRTSGARRDSLPGDLCVTGAALFGWL